MLTATVSEQVDALPKKWKGAVRRWLKELADLGVEVSVSSLTICSASAKEGWDKGCMLLANYHGNSFPGFVLCSSEEVRMAFGIPDVPDTIMNCVYLRTSGKQRLSPIDPLFADYALGLMQATL